jgi:hypothetical protein
MRCRGWFSSFVARVVKATKECKITEEDAEEMYQGGGPARDEAGRVESCGKEDALRGDGRAEMDGGAGMGVVGN